MIRTPVSHRFWSTLAVAISLPLVCLTAEAQHHGGMGMGRHGMMNSMRHDSAAMAHMSVIHELVMHHDQIARSVTNLPDGIRTVTESADSLLARRIRDHVATMDARIVSGKDPGWPMESEALRMLYKNSAMIRTKIDSTPRGVVIEQTSSDSATVAALQQHAAEVSDVVRRGMEAMHAAMMKHGEKPMMHERHGPPSDTAGTRRPGPPGHVHRPPPRAR